MMWLHKFTTLSSAYKKGKFPYPLLLAALLFLVGTSCEDIFLTDLGEKEVQLLAPADLTQTDVSSVTFWWAYVNGADSYQLQVVTPDFGAIEQLVLDTTVSADKFTEVLLAGNYQWRVRALNAVSESPFTTHGLEILNTEDISRQKVVLSYPTDAFVSNAESLTFRWVKLFSADDYLFEWKYENGDYAGDPATLSDNYLEKTFDQEGTFIWSVKGHNSSTETYTLASDRSITIDWTAPLQAQLSYPDEGETVEVTDEELTFSWQRQSVSGAQEFDSLFVYKSTSSAAVLKVKTTAKSYTWANAQAGTYSYEVISYDEAGNKGAASDSFQFTVSEAK